MRWQPWTPAEVAERLDGVDVPWYVAGGWAIDLFLGEQRRAHDDLEIGVPADQFALIRDALPGQWHVPTPAGELPLGDEQLTHGHQTWLLDPTADAWRLDVFREPAREGRWVCRRDAAITRTYDELIAHTADGVPY
ncbi:MAG: hypothetical protein JWM90_783, partial [Thermoleophilia bacterium]|nr:hypothetical protein [Thermoleophilia bacterium]